MTRNISHMNYLILNYKMKQLLLFLQDLNLRSPSANYICGPHSVAGWLNVFSKMLKKNIFEIRVIELIGNLNNMNKKCKQKIN